MPYSIFVDIVAEFERDYGDEQADCCGRKPVDRRLLILGSLWYIRITITFAALEEVTRVSDSLHRTFFLNKFLDWGVCLAQDNIFLPWTEDEYEKVKGVYWSKGLP